MRVVVQIRVGLLGGEDLLAVCEVVLVNDEGNALGYLGEVLEFVQSTALAILSVCYQHIVE